MFFFITSSKHFFETIKLLPDVISLFPVENNTKSYTVLAIVITKHSSAFVFSTDDGVFTLGRTDVTHAIELACSVFFTVDKRGPGGGCVSE